MVPDRSDDDAPEAVRRRVVAAARTLVVKIGTNVLSRPDDTVDEDRIADLAEQLHRICRTGRRVVVVSSGAIGVGIGLLGLKRRPGDLPHLQAAAAAGQAKLIGLYDRALRSHGYHAAQVLLTGNDFKQRARYLNVRNTLNTLFEFPIIPIVNENDTVSVSEIKFGDNDRLAALVASLVPDPLLVILSVVDGLYDGDPSAASSRLVPLVDRWDDTLLGLASQSRSQRGTGGMQTKLDAVRTATSVGENVIIANGTRPAVLDLILAGETVGTLFLASPTTVPAWKRWIRDAVPPKGRVILDDGACRAIAQEGRSLLPIGVRQVEGRFGKGDVISLMSPARLEIARGLTNFDSDQTARLAGKRTSEIAAEVGAMAYGELVHRDNLVVLIPRP